MLQKFMKTILLKIYDNYLSIIYYGNLLRTSNNILAKRRNHAIACHHLLNLTTIVAYRVSFCGIIVIITVQHARDLFL